MLKFVVLVSLLGLVPGLPAAVLKPEYEHSIISGVYNYFEEIGISAYERITKDEKAINFDGSRIVGGSAASVGQYPFYGGVIISLASGSLAVCGSALISHNRAVTAAHCWFDGINQATQFEVAFGTTTLNSGGTRRTTNQVTTHPNWNPTQSIENDVAIMVLTWVHYDRSVRNIALASGSDLYVDQTAWAVGFGVTADGEAISLSQQLHHVSVPVISNEECRTWFGDAIVDSTLCVSGAGGRSPCAGDSGGPLHITESSRTLIGIYTFGYRWGCQLGWPTGFARVSSFQAWFFSNLG